MISRRLVLKLFDGFSIKRWNDRICPIDLTEIDKQSYKSILTYFFGKMEEKKGNYIDWEYLVYGNLFAYLKNIVLSDIKSSVIGRIKNSYNKEYTELNMWVINQYKNLINDMILENFSKFLTNNDENNLSLKVLRAAHKYSTLREFEIIKSSNLFSPDMDRIKIELDKDIKKYNDLKAIKELNKKESFYEVICTIEKLRFQTRWSQTQRIPKTSVLGHSFFVAVLTIFLTEELKPCSKRMVNNFFAGLYHDLPEAVTRDIVSPVKKATESFPKIVSEIENEICKRELYPNIPSYILDDLKYLSGKKGNLDEFSNRYIENNTVKEIKKDNLIEKYNFDEFSLIDGKIIKLADHIAAFVEADQSIKYGISSVYLQEGKFNIKCLYHNKKDVNGVNIKDFFMNFDIRY
jgi:putative hydrolase of HD superfamily